MAVNAADRPIAFLASGVQPPVLFIYQLAVRREWQRRGIGRALLARAANYAQRSKLQGVGLTTFCDVPWNGPYYAGQGYELVEDAGPSAVHASGHRGGANTLAGAGSAPLRHGEGRRSWLTTAKTRERTPPV